MICYDLPDEALKFVDNCSLDRFAKGLLATDQGKSELVDLLEQTCLLADNGEECYRYLQRIDLRLFYREQLVQWKKKIRPKKYSRKRDEAKVARYDAIYDEYCEYRVENEGLGSPEEFYGLYWYEEEKDGKIEEKNELGISLSTFQRLIRRKHDEIYIKYQQYVKKYHQTCIENFYKVYMSQGEPIDSLMAKTEQELLKKIILKKEKQNRKQEKPVLEFEASMENYVPWEILTEREDEFVCFFLGVVNAFIRGRLLSFLLEIYLAITFKYVRFKNGVKSPYRHPFNQYPSYFNLGGFEKLD